MLQNLHDIPIKSKPRPRLNQIKSQSQSHFQSSVLNIPDDIVILSQPQLVRSSRKKNYGRLVKRLTHKFRLSRVVVRKTDKSKVFHLGRIEDYQRRSEEYMIKTEAYQCLGNTDPLPDLIQRTNKYLLNLRLAKWITQKQYELLCITTNKVELAHLYYLPKAHKPGTPLRPIIAGLKHPTTKISKFLDNLLRPLFNQMASDTTVSSGFELVKQLEAWSTIHLKEKNSVMHN